jgi:hypothetical protein
VLRIGRRTRLHAAVATAGIPWSAPSGGLSDFQGRFPRLVGVQLRATGYGETDWVPENGDGAKDRALGRRLGAVDGTRTGSRAQRARPD